MVYIDQVEGTDIFQLGRQIGNRGPFHCIAALKSILAFLEGNELENIFKGLNLTRITDKTIKTITSLKHLKKELKVIKRIGF